MTAEELIRALSREWDDTKPVGRELLRDFMREFVQQQQDAAEDDAWFRRQVQIGLNSANAGDLISAEEVEAEAAAWRAETRRKIAGTTS